MIRPRGFDLDRPCRIHMIGIGGAGMSAIAVALAAQGHRISGSDRADGPVLDTLREAGVEVRVYRFQKCNHHLHPKYNAMTMGTWCRLPRNTQIVPAFRN